MPLAGTPLPIDVAFGCSIPPVPRLPRNSYQACLELLLFFHLILLNPRKEGNGGRGTPGADLPSASSLGSVLDVALAPPQVSLLPPRSGLTRASQPFGVQSTPSLWQRPLSPPPDSHAFLHYTIQWVSLGMAAATGPAGHLPPPSSIIPSSTQDHRVKIRPRRPSNQERPAHSSHLPDRALVGPQPASSLYTKGGGGTRPRPHSKSQSRI